MSQDYLTMGGLKVDDVVFIGNIWMFSFILLHFSNPCISREHHNVFAPSLWNPNCTSFFSRSIYPLYSHVSLLQFFQPLLSHPSVFIYRLSLVGLSWWEGSFPRWWVPLSHIPDQMGAIICDRYDFLGTCTKHQLVLSWRIPKALFLDLGIIGDAWSGCKLGPSPFRGRARCSVSK